MDQKDSSKADQPERTRVEERQDALRAADLFMPGREFPVACLLKDVSKTGMKLIYDSPLKLPKQLKVILHHPHAEHKCDVIWQKDKEIGLQILEAD